MYGIVAFGDEPLRQGICRTEEGDSIAKPGHDHGIRITDLSARGTI